jgi:hypothetical protein
LEEEEERDEEKVEELMKELDKWSNWESLRGTGLEWVNDSNESTVSREADEPEKRNKLIIEARKNKTRNMRGTERIKEGEYPIEQGRKEKHSTRIKREQKWRE